MQNEDMTSAEWHNHDEYGADVDQFGYPDEEIGVTSMNLNELAKEVYKTAQKRAENGASIKTDTVSMLKHCATEVVEAMEAYADYFRAPIATELEEKKIFSAELADIITCILIIAGREEIDIEQALEDCQKKNRARAEGRGDKK